MKRAVDAIRQKRNANRCRRACGRAFYSRDDLSTDALSVGRGLFRFCSQTPRVCASAAKGERPPPSLGVTCSSRVRVVCRRLQQQLKAALNCSTFDDPASRWGSKVRRGAFQGGQATGLARSQRAVALQNTVPSPNRSGNGQETQAHTENAGACHSKERARARACVRRGETRARVR